MVFHFIMIQYSKKYMMIESFLTILNMVFAVLLQTTNLYRPALTSQSYHSRTWTSRHGRRIRRKIRTRWTRASARTAPATITTPSRNKWSRLVSSFKAICSKSSRRHWRPGRKSACKRNHRWTRWSHCSSRCLSLPCTVRRPFMSNPTPPIIK